MADTSLDICSRALVLLGEQPITSFKQGTAASQVAALHYPSTLREALGEYRWNFAKHSAQLSRLAVVPVETHRTAAYELPADYLNVRAVKVSGSNISYELIESRLLCDAAEAEVVVMEYTRQVAEADFPPYFTAFLERLLAHKFCQAVTANESMGDTWEKRAERARRSARSIDAQSQTARRVPISRFKAVRHGG